jgi:uncharacterized protein YfaP (DUF2135 family)
LSFLLLACNGGPDPLVSPSPVGTLTIDDIALSVTAPGVTGLRRDGAPPASSGGPEIFVTGNNAVVNGGTLAVEVSANAPFDTLYVAVNVPTEGVSNSAPAAIEGYFETRLPSTQMAASMLLSLPQDIPLGEFDLLFAVVSPDGAVGPYVPLHVNVIQVGTGDVQVTLSWDADSDVDLHVIDPNGEEVYYARQQVSSGGQLDLDSNAGCNIDGIRNENITWPAGTAPAGTYIVRVDYWDSCGVAATNYTVRINNGGNVEVVTGRFTGSGDQGGAGSGTTVTTFVRTSGSSTTTLRLDSQATQPAAAVVRKGVKQ